GWGWVLVVWWLCGVCGGVGMGGWFCWLWCWWLWWRLGLCLGWGGCGVFVVFGGVVLVGGFFAWWIGWWCCWLVGWCVGCFLGFLGLVWVWFCGCVWWLLRLVGLVCFFCLGGFCLGGF
ncbi:hypothetical protein RA268_28160, partial [Pseudomonas syringae pv. tagetis]